jgi:glyceraldehyde-3-phosphate dehydrogenase (NAD(P))
MIKVGVNGYGTIGRRVADAVRKQEDMELVGVVKARPDYKARIALDKGLSIYAVDMKGVEGFKAGGIAVKGTVNDLLQRVDVVVDATPDDVGASYKPVYEQANVRALFQGGEEHSLTGTSFVAQVNFNEALNKRMVRVVSCNTTGLCRTLHAIDSTAGIARARAVLARRAADPDEVSKGPIDAVVLDPATVPSHHGPDVQTVLHGMKIVTMAFKVPTTHMHLHSLILTLKQSSTTREQIIEALERAPRMKLVDAKSGAKSTAQVMDMAREMGRPRNDMYEAVVWRDSVSVVDGEAHMFLGVHQEAIVLPENIDAVRAVSGGYSAEQSMKMTDVSLGIPHK